jgi:hypothetical protein
MDAYQTKGETNARHSAIRLAAGVVAPAALEVKGFFTT